MTADNYRKLGDHEQRLWWTGWDIGLWATVFIALAIVVGIGLAGVAFPFITPALLPAIAIAFFGSFALYGIATGILRQFDDANVHRRNITKAGRFGTALMPGAWLAVVGAGVLSFAWPILLVGTLSVPVGLMLLRGTIFRNLWSGEVVKATRVPLPEDEASDADDEAEKEESVSVTLSLEEAIQTGNLTELARHVSQGVSLKSRCILAYGIMYSPFQYAVAMGNLSAVQWLEQNDGVGDNNLIIRVEDKTLLQLAVYARSPSVLQHLLNQYGWNEVDINKALELAQQKAATAVNAGKQCTRSEECAGLLSGKLAGIQQAAPPSPTAVKRASEIAAMVDADDCYSDDSAGGYEWGDEWGGDPEAEDEEGDSSLPFASLQGLHLHSDGSAAAETTPEVLVNSVDAAI